MARKDNLKYYLLNHQSAGLNAQQTIYNVAPLKAALKLDWLISVI